MKLSPRRAEMLSLVALILQAVFFFLLIWISGWTLSAAVHIEAWHFLGGTLIWLILFLQFRQRRLAEQEHRDTEQYERLRREGKDTSVFEGVAVEGSLYIAARRSAWIEKYLIWIFGVLTAGYLLTMGFFMYRLVRANPEPVLARHDIIIKSAGFLVLFGLVSFFFSRYAVGLSRQVIWRPLRAGGSFLLSNALACLALAVVLLLADYKYLMAERYLTYVLVFLMIVIGAEMILNLVLDAYQPRIKGRYRRAAYESRILGLFSEPGDILQTFAHAMDYQFGFKVSETWFYKLLERAVLPLIVLNVIVMYLMTSLAIVDPGYVGVCERFGSPLNKSQPWESGLHLKMPWPIDRVRTFPTDQLQYIEIGFKKGKEHEGKPVLWTVKHWEQEYPFMVAVSDTGRFYLSQPVPAQDKAEPAADTNISSENASGDGFDREPIIRNDFDLLVVALSVHYLIDDVAKFGYSDTHGYESPHSLLEAICYREAVHFAAHSDLAGLMGPGRNQTTQALKEVIQARADRYQMGVKIAYVGLVSIHPPVEVAESFENVVSALQDRQGLVLNAYGGAREVIANEKGKRSETIEEANAYLIRRASEAKAVVERFRRQMEAYQKGGSIYLWREYLTVLDDTLTHMRKYVMTSPHVDRWVYEVDLKEKLEPDLFEGLGLPETKQETAK